MNLTNFLYAFEPQSGLSHVGVNDLSISIIILSTQRQPVETLLVGHHRRLVGPGPARSTLGYATAPHPHLLVAITTVSQEIQILLQSRAFCILVMLFVMVNSAVQKVPAAAMDNPLHGLV